MFATKAHNVSEGRAEASKASLLKELNHPPYAYTVCRFSSFQKSMELRLGHCPLLISSIPILLFFVAVENDVDRSIARVFLTDILMY